VRTLTQLGGGRHEWAQRRHQRRVVKVPGAAGRGVRAGEALHRAVVANERRALHPGDERQQLELAARRVVHDRGQPQRPLSVRAERVRAHHGRLEAAAVLVEEGRQQPRAQRRRIREHHVAAGRRVATVAI
jgi:hypothetical protein